MSAERRGGGWPRASCCPQPVSGEQGGDLSEAGRDADSSLRGAWAPAATFRPAKPRPARAVPRAGTATRIKWTFYASECCRRGMDIAEHMSSRKLRTGGSCHPAA
ncbi:unnamed protein product [Caretta caretta]